MAWQERISHGIVKTLFCSLFPKDYLKCFNADMQKKQEDLLSYFAWVLNVMGADLLLIHTTQTGQPRSCVYFSVLALKHMSVGTVWS